MARPRNRRRVGCTPRRTYFKPAGVPKASLTVVVLTVDEWEALRLADYEGLYHDAAARQMNVSRPTFGRIIEVARRKVTRALVKGQALTIKGGDFEMTTRKFSCYDCKHEWELPYGTGRPQQCPACQSTNLHRTENECGQGRGGQGGRRCRNRGGRQSSAA
jgi:predicted DNA-binding protein (UPF0251 family)